MEGTHVADPARRPRHSCKVVMSIPALEHVVFVLKRQAVLLPAADARHATSAMAVGQELEARLRIQPHQLRITCHDPKDYLIIFDLPIHPEQVAKLGALTVDGAKFFIKRWHEDDHAALRNLTLHVWIVIENLPMHFSVFTGLRINYEPLWCQSTQIKIR